MQSLGIFGGLSIMSKIIRQADGVHLGLPSSKENISSTGKMIKTELNMYHCFWIWVPSFCLPGWSRMTRRSTMAHGTYHMDQIKPCNTSTAALGHTTGLGCPSSFNAESRKKKLMKEIFREAIRVSLPGSAVEMWWGAKPPHRHQSPAERCLSLQSHIDLHWESATASQILFSFVLATWSEFTWATSLWPKSALKHRFDHLHKSKKLPLAWPVLMLLGEILEAISKTRRHLRRLLVGACCCSVRRVYLDTRDESSSIH